jgi:hypothetical protein
MTLSTETERPVSEPWRRKDGTFGPGNPGKPRGATHKFNREVLERLGGLTDKALTTLERKLEEGDLKAATFVISRFSSAERTVDVPVDPAGLAEAIAAGDVTPTEANRLALALRSLTEAENVENMRARLSEIEAILEQQQGKGR